MRLKLPGLILLTTSIALTGASAQNLAQIPLPTPPLIAPVPENADWTVTVQYPPKSPGPGAPTHVGRRIVEIHTTKTGKFRRDLITYIDGSIEEHWFIGSFYLWTPPNQAVSVYDLNNIPPNPDGSRNIGSGFPGVEWISLNHYDKAVVFESIPCYHYQDSSGGTEAWINVQTRLPAAYKIGNDLYRFNLNPPPISPLTLPPAYEKAWQACQKIFQSR